MPSFSEIIKGEALLLKTAFKREGFWYVLREGCKYVFGWPIRIGTVTWLRLTRGNAAFVFRGREYRYLYHSYNYTWQNDRTFEIPLCWSMVQENAGKHILEIGNVLRHYFDCRHDVVDLFEEYPGIINLDIIEFFPREKYDFVISISTFEHIGWDENPRHPPKLLSAIDHVKENVLTPGGKLVITVPLGQNTELDKYLFNGKVPFSYINCMKQYDSKKNLWQEATWEDILKNEFDLEGRWQVSQHINLILEFNKPA